MFASDGQEVEYLLVEHKEVAAGPSYLHRFRVVAPLVHLDVYIPPGQKTEYVAGSVDGWQQQLWPSDTKSPVIVAVCANKVHQRILLLVRG